jgi:hypothetical protein
MGRMLAQVAEFLFGSRGVEREAREIQSGDESPHSKGPDAVRTCCQIKQKCYIWLHE